MRDHHCNKLIERKQMFHLGVAHNNIYDFVSKFTAKCLHRIGPKLAGKHSPLSLLLLLYLFLYLATATMMPT